MIGYIEFDLVFAAFMILAVDGWMIGVAFTTASCEKRANTRINQRDDIIERLQHQIIDREEADRDGVRLYA